jgi:hypothetical protein
MSNYTVCVLEIEIIAHFCFGWNSHLLRGLNQNKRLRQGRLVFWIIKIYIILIEMVTRLLTLVFYFKRYFEIIRVIFVWYNTSSSINRIGRSHNSIKCIINYTLMSFNLFDCFLLLNRYPYPAVIVLSDLQPVGWLHRDIGVLFRDITLLLLLLYDELLMVLGSGWLNSWL